MKIAVHRPTPSYRRKACPVLDTGPVSSPRSLDSSLHWSDGDSGRTSQLMDTERSPLGPEVELSAVRRYNVLCPFKSVLRGWQGRGPQLAERRAPGIGRTPLPAPARVSLDRSILSPDEMRRALTRIAHEVLESNRGASDLVFVGLHTRGVPLARRLSGLIGRFEGSVPPVGSLDIGPYRDDFSRTRPRIRPTDIPVSIDGRPVVLVDDVLYTGRSVRAALDATSSRTSGVRAGYSWPCLSTGGTGSSPSGPTTWARTCPRHGAKRCGSSSPRPTTETAFSW